MYELLSFKWNGYIAQFMLDMVLLCSACELDIDGVVELYPNL